MEFREQYFIRDRGYLLLLMNYNLGLHVISEWMINSLTFCWNYTNIFISLIGICLAHRFNQINQRLAEMEGKVPTLQIFFNKYFSK